MNALIAATAGYCVVAVMITLSIAICVKLVYWMLGM